MYWIKTPSWVQALFPRRTWRIPTLEKVLYLTFDDGPTPGVTETVLDHLRAFGAKATFFCIGERVRANPALFQALQDAGHAIGNHTHTHPNGWHSSTKRFLADVERSESFIASNLFRPPYGKLLPAQARHLASRYRIIMWDVMSGDFDATLSSGQVYQNVIDHAEVGSIIVLHDNEKAAPRMLEALPQLLDYYTSRGFYFEQLPPV